MGKTPSSILRVDSRSPAALHHVGTVSRCIQRTIGCPGSYLRERYRSWDKQRSSWGSAGYFSRRSVDQPGRWNFVWMAQGTAYRRNWYSGRSISWCVDKRDNVGTERTHDGPDCGLGDRGDDRLVGLYHRWERIL